MHPPSPFPHPLIDQIHTKTEGRGAGLSCLKRSVPEASKRVKAEKEPDRANRQHPAETQTVPSNSAGQTLIKKQRCLFPQQLGDTFWAKMYILESFPFCQC